MAGNHRLQIRNTWISKASSTQRAGRTGRMRPGTVTSEIHRMPLQEVILNLRITFGTASQFNGVVPILQDLLEPPEMSNVDASFDYLFEAGMISFASDE
eukprot:gene39497-52071_t